MRLRVLPDGALELVIPKGGDPRLAAAFVESRRDWIERTQRRVRRDLNELQRACRSLPQRIDLPSVNESWRLECVQRTLARPRLVQEPECGLTYHGDGSDTAACRRLLRSWLRRRAKERLPPWLREVSAAVGLGFEDVRVRAQKRRWGSCSSTKHISLNCQLLFLPPDLVDYLFVHELCHTVHLDHSPRYWSLVESKLPNYRDLDRQLRRATARVPLWYRCE